MALRVRPLKTMVCLVAALWLCASPASAVTLDMVTVGNPGNSNDTTGYGAVNYSYQIGKFDVTISQYTAFLNAVAQSDPYSLYSPYMATNLHAAGISQSGSSGSYSYSVIGPFGATPAGASSPGNRPVTNVSWFDAARFANWMQNGQGSASTETGAYTLNGATSGTAPAKNPNAMFYIPTENEWYKAAFYSPVKGGAGSPGYYTYATQSDSTPGNVIGSGSNQANYEIPRPHGGYIYSVTQTTGTPNQNYLTEVGAFTNSASYYGTFDQSGNVDQWNDLEGTGGSSLGLRGGNWSTTNVAVLSSNNRYTYDPSLEYDIVGFRLASLAADLVIGDNVSNQAVTLDGGMSRSFSDVALGVNAGNDDNSLTITNAGTLLTSASNVVVGVSGTGNSMVVSAGGTVVTSSGTYTGVAEGGVIGYYASASNNTVTVTGSGSAWNNAYNVIVGYGGSGNSLLVSSGGAVTAGNTAYSATLGYDAGSANNSVTVTGSGSTFSNNSVLVGVSGTGNSMVVSAGGRVLTGGGGSYIGTGSTSSGNSVLVTGTGSEWTNGSFLFVGDLGSGNSLTVSDGGSVTAGVVDVGYSPGNSGNSVVVSGGGSISSASTYIGRYGSSNSVLVTGSGSTWTNTSSAPLYIGFGGTDSSLTVADGGSVSATQTSIGFSCVLNIGRFGTSDAAGTLSSSTIAFGTGSGRINFNQSDTTTLSSAISGTGSLYQLGSGTTILTGHNTYAGTTSVSAGSLLINGNQSAANGAIAVAAGATIGGSGTTGGVVTVDGILSPGNSPGVFTAASVILGGSSTSLFEINGAARGTQYDGVDVTTESGLTYGGALSLSFGNASAFGATTFDLFSFTGTPSGNFTSVTSTGFYAGTWSLASGIWSLESGGQTLSFTPSTGDLVVAVPEPSTSCMALAGLACGGYAVWRRRVGPGRR